MQRFYRSTEEESSEGKESKSITRTGNTESFQQQNTIMKVGNGKNWQTVCRTEDMMLIYTVEKEEFKALLESFDSKHEVPSRKYFYQTALPALYTKAQETVSN